MKRVLYQFIILILGLVLVGCQKPTPLDPLKSISLASTVTHSVKVNFCLPPPVQQKQYLKTVIILDHSGSNALNYKMAADGSGAPDVINGSLDISPIYATDPTGLTRYGSATTPGTLLNYLSTLAPNDPADPTRFFAAVDFNSSASTYPGSSSGFTSDIAGFYNQVSANAVASGGGPNDTGGTSYLSALNAAYNIINNDVQTAKSCSEKATTATPTTSCPKPGVATSSSYVVVFMSDGSPIINVSGVGANGVVTGPIVLTRESTTEILGKVGSIMALQSQDKFVTSMNMFTIYYYAPGNVDLNSQALLAQMAKAGNGLAYNALSGTNIDYNQFQPPSKVLEYNLSDVFVTNANGVWWTDGKFKLDSDSDGLPDEVETSWGSDPLNAISDSNGVSDFVKYTLKKGAACISKNALGRCMDPVTNYRTGSCSGISSSVSGGRVQFKSSDPNGMNDCEKLILGNSGGIGVPDSNSDNIPDWLEFLNNIPFQLGTTPAVTQILQDGYTTYQKIKYALPVNTPLNMLPNIKPAKYRLNLVSPANSQKCYELTVDDFPTTSETAVDKVRVDIIMKSNLVKSSYLYRKGYKSFLAGEPLLEISDWNDGAEITNKTWSSWP